jgi:tetratricopeptide (TPR) repeat protein
MRRFSNGRSFAVVAVASLALLGIMELGSIRVGRSPALDPAPARDSGNSSACWRRRWVPPDQTLAACEAIIQAHSGDSARIAAAHNSRAIVYRENGDRERSLAEFRECTRLDPVGYFGLVCQAGAFTTTEDFDHAIASYDQAIRIRPFAETFVARGLLYKFKGQWERAIADFTEAIRLDPNDVTAFLNRGVTYDQENDHDRAIDDYNEAIRLDPGDAYVFLNRGSAYSRKKDYELAIADYDEALRLYPNWPLAFYGRGTTQFLRKNYDGAIADYSEAIKLKPDDAKSWYYRGRAFWEKGDFAKANADIAEAKRLNIAAPPARQ